MRLFKVGLSEYGVAGSAERRCQANRTHAHISQLVGDAYAYLRGLARRQQVEEKLIYQLCKFRRIVRIGRKDGFAVHCSVADCVIEFRLIEHIIADIFGDDEYNHRYKRRYHRSGSALCDCEQQVYIGGVSDYG